jgi:hypothetical protein
MVRWKEKAERLSRVHIQSLASRANFSSNLNRLYLGAKSGPLFVCCFNYIIDGKYQKIFLL